MRPPRLWFAPLLDLASIVTFVLVGARRHEVDEGFGWFFEVLWPLCVGIYAVALLSRLYLRDRGVWLALTVTILGGIAITQFLRGTFTHDPWIGIFTAVALGYLALTMFGWRLVAALVSRRRPAPAS